MNAAGRRLSARSLQIAINRRRRTLGLSPDVSAMALRHSAGARMAAAGKSPRSVADALGVGVAAVLRYWR